MKSGGDEGVTKIKAGAKQKRQWTAEALTAEIVGEAHIQHLRNSVMHAMEEARRKAIEVEAPEPPALTRVGVIG